jgi:hypothetical protein
VTSGLLGTTGLVVDGQLRCASFAEGELLILLRQNK